MKFSICVSALLASSASGFGVGQNRGYGLQRIGSSQVFSSIPGSGSSGPAVPLSSIGPTPTATPPGAIGSSRRFFSDRRGPDGRIQYDRYNRRRYMRRDRNSRYESSMNLADNEVLVQGNSLKTWTYNSPAVERVQVAVRTEGRPFDTEVDLWQGPDNTPQKMRVYSEDGSMRPFQVLIETPRAPNTVAIRNVGQMEFPMIAAVQADTSNRMPMMDSELRTIQGGALRTYPFDPLVDSVEIVLKTDGRPLNALIELLQGPNNKKKVIEIYTEDGMDRPFTAIVETPGSGNVIRIVNTSPVEFPLVASVQPYEVGKIGDYGEPVLGGDSDAAMATTISQW